MFAREMHLRPSVGHDHAHVTYVELFFDLVFAFAVTQLSYTLLVRLSPIGALQTGLLMMAIWSVWIYTSWMVDRLDPERPAVRLMLFVIMAAGLVMSASISQAFGARGASFAGAYVFMQIGRSLFMLWALKHHDAGNYRNFQRITVWLVVAGAFWFAGAFLEGQQRIALWAIAIGIEYLSPAVGIWVPGLGRSTPRDWKMQGAHLAQPCTLLVIIALGESLLLTGAVFADTQWTTNTVTAFILAILGSVAKWAVYFNVGAERGGHHITPANGPGRLGSTGFAYLHILIVAGIVVSAVADKLELVRPDGETELKSALIILGGPALYLVGTGLFKRLTASHFPPSHIVGLGVLAALAAAATIATPLHLAAGATAVMMVVALWEWVSLRQKE